MASMDWDRVGREKRFSHNSDVGPVLGSNEPCAPEAKPEPEPEPKSERKRGFLEKLLYPKIG